MLIIPIYADGSSLFEREVYGRNIDRSAPGGNHDENVAKWGIGVPEGE